MAGLFNREQVSASPSRIVELLHFGCRERAVPKLVHELPRSNPVLTPFVSDGSQGTLTRARRLSTKCPLSARSVMTGWFSGLFLKIERFLVFRPARVPNTFPRVSGFDGSLAAIL
jgi:hypothetical protein